jgi:hypothetical protein
MRQIEKEMNTAINSIRKHRRDKWTKGNTSVVRDGVDIKVYLHGNLIAHYGCLSGLVWLRDAGWQPVTTKSRLNAIANYFGVMGVYQKNWEWHFDNGQNFEYIGQYSIAFMGTK